MKIIQPKAELINYNPQNENNVAISAKLTHSEEGVDSLDKNMTDEDKARLVRHMVEIGHTSTAEHTHYFFKVVCSRACSHQLVRHRIGTAYSQRSERYVEADNFDYIAPPEVQGDKQLLMKFDTAMNSGIAEYKMLREEGVKKEDARYVLPRLATELTVSFNARSLRHFFDLRLDKTAQWEIRDLAEQMLEQVKEVNPNLFFDYSTE